MPIYCVYVDETFMKAFGDEYNAQLLQLSLTVFFLQENLPYKAFVKCEVR